MQIQYLEFVSGDVESTCSCLERLHGVKFGDPEEALGGARAAALPDGRLVGVREPLAEHEEPIVRTYVQVEDIEAATRTAVDAGATLAYGPAEQGSRGTFAIYILCGVQHGLWQR